MSEATIPTMSEATKIIATYGSSLRTSFSKFKKLKNRKNRRFIASLHLHR